MAINKGKVIFWSIVVAAVGAGGFFAWKHFSKGVAEKHINVDKDGNLIDPTKDQDGNVIKPVGGGGAGGGGNVGSGGGNSSAIPFTNNTEGNAFRAWVNNVHAPWALANNLDKTGSYNNSYIKKAWDKYGAEYKLVSGGTYSPILSAIRIPKTGDRIYATTRTIPFHYSGLDSPVGVSYFPAGALIGRVSSEGSGYLKVYTSYGAPVGSDGKTYESFYIIKDKYKVG